MNINLAPLLKILQPVLQVAEIFVPGPLGDILKDATAGIESVNTITTAAAPLATAVPAIGTLLGEAAPIIQGIEAILTALAHPASPTSGAPSSDVLVPALQALWPAFPTLQALLPVASLPVVVPALENLLAAIGLFKVPATAATAVAAATLTVPAATAIPTAAAVARVTSAPVAKPVTPTPPTPATPTPMPEAGSVAVQPVTPALGANLEGRGGAL